MATWVRSLTANLVGSADADLSGAADLDTDTSPADFDGSGVTSVRFQYTVQVSSGTLVDDQYDLQSVEIETSGGTQLATVAATGTIDSGTSSVVIDLTDNSPSTSGSTADWEGAALNGTAAAPAGVIAQLSQSMKADGAAVEILSSSVTITITYTPGGDGDITGFRWRDDSTALGTDGGWLAAEDTNITTHPEQILRCRFQLQAQTNPYNEALKVQGRKNGTGGWIDLSIPAGTPAGDPVETAFTPAGVQSVLSAGFADGASILSTHGDNLTDPAAGTWVNGLADEASNAIAAINLSAANNFTEIEVAVHFPKFYWTGSALAENADGDYWELRLVESDGTAFPSYTFLPRCTFNGGNLIGGCWPEVPHHIGPIVDTNDNMYFFMESWEDTAVQRGNVALKSTDGGVTWTAVDLAGGAAIVNDDWEAAAVIQSNQTTGLVHIFTHHSSEVRQHQFRTSDHATNPDTWGTVDAAVETAFTAVNASMQAVSAAQRSDGDLLVFYNRGDGTDNEVAFETSTNGGSTWTGTPTVLDGTASANHHNAWPVMAENDLCYIFYTEEPGAYGDNTASIYYKTLSSTDVLTADGSRVTISGATMQSGAGERSQIFGATYHDDGGVEVVTVMYTDRVNGSAATPARSRAVRDGSLQAEKTITTTDVNLGGGNGGSAGSHQPDARGAVYAGGKKLIALYVEDTTFDLLRNDEDDDAGWGTEAEIQTINGGYVSASVLERSGATYLTYVYDDGSADVGGGQGPVFYGEALLASPGNPRPYIASMVSPPIIHRDRRSV